jgi:hypothetical protein
MKVLLKNKLILIILWVVFNEFNVIELFDKYTSNVNHVY